MTLAALVQSILKFLSFPGGAIIRIFGRMHISLHVSWLFVSLVVASKVEKESSYAEACLQSILNGDHKTYNQLLPIVSASDRLYALEELNEEHVHALKDTLHFDVQLLFLTDALMARNSPLFSLIHRAWFREPDCWPNIIYRAMKAHQLNTFANWTWIVFSGMAKEHKSATINLLWNNLFKRLPFERRRLESIRNQLQHIKNEIKMHETLYSCILDDDRQMRFRKFRLQPTARTFKLFKDGKEKVQALKGLSDAKMQEFFRVAGLSDKNLQSLLTIDPRIAKNVKHSSREDKKISEKIECLINKQFYTKREIETAAVELYLEAFRANNPELASFYLLLIPGGAENSLLQEHLKIDEILSKQEFNIKEYNNSEDKNDFRQAMPKDKSYEGQWIEMSDMSTVEPQQ